MPYYEYKCRCKGRLIDQRSMKDPDTIAGTVCSVCGAKKQRIFQVRMNPNPVAWREENRPTDEENRRRHEYDKIYEQSWNTTPEEVEYEMVGEGE